MARRFEAQEAVKMLLNSTHSEPGVIGVGECVGTVIQNAVHGIEEKIPTRSCSSEIWVSVRIANLEHQDKKIMKVIMS